MIGFEYIKTKTLDEAVLLKDKYGSDARVLAGGTDLIVNLKDNVVSCKLLIDIKEIPEMAEISCSGETGLRVGGAVSLNDLMDNEDVRARYPILIDSGKTLANSLLRNRATMLGNICSASPAGDMIPAALVLGGSVEAVSVDGTRNIPLKDFFIGVKKTVLLDNEIAVRVVFPVEGGRGTYLKKSRIKGHDLAQMGAAGILKDDGRLVIALGAAAPTPVIFDNLGSFEGKALSDEYTVKGIIGNILPYIYPISDQRASKEYRIAMAEYLIRGVLQKISKEV